MGNFWALQDPGRVPLLYNVGKMVFEMVDQIHVARKGNLLNFIRFREPFPRQVCAHPVADCAFIAYSQLWDWSLYRTYEASGTGWRWTYSAKDQHFVEELSTPLF